jgi:cytochrome c biogenesis protein CcmG/thiol:disulfide interchange protein DsbE
VSEGIRVGSRVPSFSLKTSTSESVTNRTLEGQIVILNFWSTTCRSCVTEIPEFQQVEESAKATVIGIALDDDGWKTVKPFLDRHQITYRVALGDESLFQRFDGSSIPYTLVLDRSQRVVKVYRKPVTREMLENDIRSIAEGA